MEKSRYEKYIVRRLEPPAHAGPTEGIRSKDWVNTGALVACDKKLFKEATSIVEYGMVRGDTAQQGIRSGGAQPHKHDYDEVCLYMGTNPDDVYDLGAEAETWLGEGEELEKIVFNTTSSLYRPAGLVHGQMIWRNVRRPVLYILIMFNSTDYVFKPASLEGRPISYGF